MYVRKNARNSVLVPSNGTKIADHVEILHIYGVLKAHPDSIKTQGVRAKLVAGKVMTNFGLEILEKMSFLKNRDKKPA